MIICIATLSAPLYPKPPRRTGIEPKTKSTISPWDVALWYSGPQTQHLWLSTARSLQTVSHFSLQFLILLAAWPSQYSFISPRLVSEYSLPICVLLGCLRRIFVDVDIPQEEMALEDALGGRGLLVLLPIVLTGPENNVKSSGNRLDLIPKNSVIRGIPLCDLIQDHEQV